MRPPRNEPFPEGRGYRRGFRINVPRSASIPVQSTIMKLKHLLLSVVAATLALGLPAWADGNHADHDHGHTHEAPKKIKAPNGGRILASVEPNAEFLLTADRKVQITFLDGAGKTVAPAGQVVTVITGERSSPTRLTFTRSGDTLISDGVVPAGEGFATVVQIKTSPGAKTMTEKFNLLLHTCSGCKLQEYACTCGH